jgi:hypothetical protein
VKLFAAFNTSADVSFDVIPAVRSPSGPCVEESNCNWELATGCAFNQTDINGQVAFLACMDESEGTALSASTKCASTASIDMTKLTACYNGPQGQAILAANSKKFNAQFPSSTTIPHTFVETKDVQANYDALKSAICAAGSKAAVCKQACVV